jgi:hypothetical protein
MKCDRLVGSDDHRRPCRRPARYLFSGKAGYRRDLPMQRAYCALHSGRGYLLESALPGWVDSVTKLDGRSSK